MPAAGPVSFKLLLDASVGPDQHQLRQLGARQRVKLSRPAQARQPVAAPGSGLHWKSVLGSLAAPWCPTNFLSHGLSRGPLSDRSTLTLLLRDFLPDIFITPVTSSCDPDMLWYLTGPWFQPSSEKLKVGQSLRQVTKCCFSLKRVSTPRWRKVSMLTPRIIWWVNKLLPEPQDRNSFGYFNPIWIRVHALHWMLEWFHKFLQHVDGNYDNVQFKVFLFTKVLKSIL